jgi:putative molybdopterin biosynthesis protein
MSQPATLSQLGKELNEHPALIRHHLKKLEKCGLVELVETRVVRGFVEKYYRANAPAFWLNEILLPASSGRQPIIFMGSDDMALRLLAEMLPHERQGELSLLLLPVGSLDGLIALRQGIAEMAGCHLLEWESGEYNLPFVRHFFPDRKVSLITLANREQGLILPSGNPLKIQTLSDLVKPGVRLINRNCGSGTRLWLDYQLQNQQIPVDKIAGYATETRTHEEVAGIIAGGDANVGIGLRAAAQKFSQDFVPLFQERYDLVLPPEARELPKMNLLLEILNSGEFRRSVEKLGGYDSRLTGVKIN